MQGARRHTARFLGCLGLILAVGSLGACTEYRPVKPIYRPSGQLIGAQPAYVMRHLVLPGETLSELAVDFDVPMPRLAQLNDIDKPFHIYVGQVLIVPVSRAKAQAVVAQRQQTPKVQQASVRPTPKPAPEPLLAGEPTEDIRPVQDAASREATRKAATSDLPNLSGDGFLWPVSGRVVDKFGAKPNGARNDGVNIAATEGAPIHAAENGIVVYAGDSIPGFGQMLLIRHADGYTTAYAHASALLRQVGDTVTRGEVIARVGATGDVASPQLHFQLREGKKAVDPTRHLVDQDTLVASVQD
jgi:murein DD-endopeptidase MepM/ murein hydrolase activator NlpD